MNRDEIPCSDVEYLGHGIYGQAVIFEEDNGCEFCDKGNHLLHPVRVNLDVDFFVYKDKIYPCYDVGRLVICDERIPDLEYTITKSYDFADCSIVEPRLSQYLSKRMCLKCSSIIKKKVAENLPSVDIDIPLRRWAYNRVRVFKNRTVSFFSDWFWRIVSDQASKKYEPERVGERNNYHET